MTIQIMFSLVIALFLIVSGAQSFWLRLIAVKVLIDGLAIIVSLQKAPDVSEGAINQVFGVSLLIVSCLVCVLSFSFSLAKGKD